MSCQHSAPRLLSRVFCSACQEWHGETEITVEVLARAFWILQCENHEGASLTARPPDDLDDQGEDTRDWCLGQVGRLTEIAKEIAKEARDG